MGGVNKKYILLYSDNTTFNPLYTDPERHNAQRYAYRRTDRQTDAQTTL